MKELSPSYIDRLEAIKEEIQASELLSKFLEEEEEEIFKEFQHKYEPLLDSLHKEVAENHPLQLEAFEERLLDDGFEGLFLPRILGYAVMRGLINEEYKYVRPQAHFKDILVKICNSANFENIKTRTGQTIQVGFALSSNIWITNLLASFNNKRVVAFLESLRSLKYRDIRDRRTAYTKYKKQFENYNYLSANIPDNSSELSMFSKGLQNFFIYRSKNSDNNSSLIEPLKKFVTNPNLKGDKAHSELILCILMFLNEDAELNKLCADHFSEFRKEEDNQKHLFELLDRLQTDPELGYSAKEDLAISSSIDLSVDDEVSRYFILMKEIHSKGYIHDDVTEQVKVYYDQHLGLSLENKCLRNVIRTYISTFIGKLEETEYTALFDLQKTMVTYMNIFSNEKFNQDVKASCMIYIKKLIKFYPDKRGRDYQDIKKFVSTSFVDMGFLNQKEVVELFKTRRKKKTT